MTVMAEPRGVRRSRRRALLALPLAVLLLAGCAANPRTDVRDLVADLIAAANDGDAAAVRSAADALIAEVESQRTELGETEANALLDLARQVQADAGLLEQAPPPPPPPSGSPTPSPSRTSASPTPSRSPSRSPSPSPTEEEPEPSQQPSPTRSPSPSQ